MRQGSSQNPLAQGGLRILFGLVILAVVLIIAGVILVKYWKKTETTQNPPASGDELQVHVLNVGQGDSILIIAPGGKAVLVDAGVPGSGHVVLDAMQTGPAIRTYNVMIDERRQVAAALIAVP